MAADQRGRLAARRKGHACDALHGLRAANGSALRTSLAGAAGGLKSPAPWGTRVESARGHPYRRETGARRHGAAHGLTPKGISCPGTTRAAAAPGAAATMAGHGARGRAVPAGRKGRLPTSRTSFAAARTG